MTKVSFSDLQVKRLRAPEKGQKRYWDTTLPGFGLRVSQGGSKTWIVLDPRSRIRSQETIGRYPIVSLSEARSEARRRLAETTLGKYRPRSIRWSAGVDEYLAEIERTRKPRTHYDYKRMLNVHFKFRDTLVSDVSAQDIERKLRKLDDRPTEKLHAFAVLRQFLNWCHRKHYLNEHPMSRMKQPGSQPSRERILTDEELGKVWKAAGDDAYGRLVKLLILTGQRRGEVSSITEDMIKGDTLTLPASITKNGRTHTIPFTPLMKELAAGGLSWSGFSKSKIQLDKRCGVEDWTLHDLRRTFASGLAGMGVALPTIEKMLNHVSGASFGGVAGVYQRYNFLPEMKAALDAWEAHVAKLAKLSNETQN